MKFLESLLRELQLSSLTSFCAIIGGNYSIMYAFLIITERFGMNLKWGCLAIHCYFEIKLEIEIESCFVAVQVG